MLKTTTDLGLDDNQQKVMYIRSSQELFEGIMMERVDQTHDSRHLDTLTFMAAAISAATRVACMEHSRAEVFRDGNKAALLKTAMEAVSAGYASATVESPKDAWKLAEQIQGVIKKARKNGLVGDY